MLMAIDRPMGVRGLVRSSASRMARMNGWRGQVVLGKVSPIGLPEQEVLAHRGMVVVAIRIEGIDEAGEPVGLQRRLHHAP